MIDTLSCRLDRNVPNQSSMVSEQGQQQAVTIVFGVGSWELEILNFEFLRGITSLGKAILYRVLLKRRLCKKA